MTITVASGTSTPTSITVVETRILVSPAAKRSIAVLLAPGELAVHEPDRLAEDRLELGEAVLSGSGEVDDLGFRNERATEHPRRGDSAADRGDDLLHGGNEAGGDGLSSGRLLVEDGHVHVAEIGEREGARNGRRGHDQHVDGGALAAERRAPMHPETMLLVNDGEAEIAELHIFLEQRVGADDDVDRALPRARAAHAGARCPCRVP